MSPIHFRLIFAFAGLAATPQIALACSCAALDPGYVVEHGDMIAEATVLSVKTEPGSACVAVLYQMEAACPDANDKACRAVYRDRFPPECATPFPVYSTSETVIELTNVWKGPQLDTLRLNYVEGDGGNCGPQLRPDQQVALIAYRQGDGSWSTDMCSLAPMGSFSDRSTPFGSVAQPILEQYRDEGRRIAALVQAAPLETETRLQLADHQATGGDIDAAISTFRRIIAHDPKVPRAYLGLALMLQKQENHVAAEWVIRDGLKQIPTDKDLLAMQRDLSNRAQ